ncbi:hypothetical protein F5X68DRAFT_263689 [Plectosphaerella plurivora]|uniref:Zn(2)-C6 fungal-type domain-containing protein n=1 Tax=Plectosphaerella plurivora TaxID=936078 RepID=A0A9P8V7W5_9PEZI|nr:hypothetical protein F5X68DRAFT_263689 [Plectosphaerella plurivora]
MVNTGHPSRACKLCRARRIKCDETKPTCLKCAKAKRVCPGYRDSFEINLRDETQTTIRKAKTAALKKAVRDGRCIESEEVAEAMLGSADAGAIDWSLVNHTSGNNDYATRRVSPELAPLLTTTASAQRRRRAISDLSGISGHNQMAASYIPGILGLDSGYESVPRGVDIPVEQQALHYFLANYVLAPPLGVGRGVMTFFLPLIESPGYKTSAMRAAFLATSLASLAGRPNSRSLRPLAEMWYSRAITELTAAMMDKVKSRDNKVLAAAILLGFYEGLTSVGALRDVFTHLSGAIALVRSRGAELLETPVGLGMFEFVRVSAIRKYTFLFDASEEEVNWWVRQAVCDRFGHHALVLNAQTAVLRTQADALVKGPRSGAKVEQVLALLKKIRDVEQELARWFEETPEKWRRSTVGTSPPMPPAPVPSGLSPTSDSYSAPSSATTAPTRPSWTMPGSSNTASPAFSQSFSSPPQSAALPTSPIEQDAEARSYGNITAFPSSPIYSFPNVWAAGKYINSHVSRIVLNEAACRCIAWLCAPADHKQIKEYRDAFAVGCEQLEQVISSTPYFFGWTGDATTTPYFPCGTANAPKGLGYICCIWPLQTCGTSIFASRAQRAFLKGRLWAVSDIMGIGQAEAFARSIVVGPPGA